MKRFFILAAFIVMALSLVVIGLASSHSSLWELVPGEPLLAVVADDLPSLATRVKNLPAAKQYLESYAHDAYSDSKLALKLADRAKRLSKLASMDLSLETLMQHAGNETVLALYDIGELSFLLLVRMSPAEQAKLAFVQSKADFTERVYDGRTYRAKIDFAAGLAFVFYQQDDLLMVSNSVDLIEGALMAQTKPNDQPRLAASENYKKLTTIKPELLDSDALVYLDMKRLRDDRYFKVYWAWRNLADFAALDAALVGFDCNGDSMRERRALMGPPAREASPELAFNGKGATAYLQGGEGATARVAAHLGWPLGSLDFDGKARSLLLVARPGVDDETGIVTADLGAVIAIDEPSAQNALNAVSEALHAAMPGLPASVAVREQNGIAALTAHSALNGAFAMRAGKLLVLANNEPLLRELATKIAEKQTGALVSAYVDGDTARSLSQFLDQADRLGALRGEGALFAGKTLPAILQAAGSFDRMTFVGRADYQETEWQ